MYLPNAFIVIPDTSSQVVFGLTRRNGSCTAADRKLQFTFENSSVTLLDFERNGEEQEGRRKERNAIKGMPKRQLLKKVTIS